MGLCHHVHVHCPHLCHKYTNCIKIHIFSFLRCYRDGLYNIQMKNRKEFSCTIVPTLNCFNITNKTRMLRSDKDYHGKCYCKKSLRFLLDQGGKTNLKSWYKKKSCYKKFKTYSSPWLFSGILLRSASTRNTKGSCNVCYCKHHVPVSL